MFYCPKHKIVFVAIPKTGTRSIYDFLQKHFGGRKYKEHHPIIPPRFKDYFSFVVVRNPYDRVCSQWWSTCKRGNDKRGYIAEFKQRKWPNTVNSWIKLRKEQGIEGRRVQGSQAIYFKHNKIDQVLHFETLQEEFNTLPFLKGEANLAWLNPTIKVDAQTHNVNSRPDWKTLMSDETIQLINHVYGEDFGVTGYNMIQSTQEM